MGRPIPAFVEEVQQFLGLANYYHRFIPKFAHIAKLLLKLTEHTASFNWTSECQQSFENLFKLFSYPVLSYPNFKLPFFLDPYARALDLTSKLHLSIDTGSAHPIRQQIDETLETLAESQLFSTLDLASGYWQVELPAKELLFVQLKNFLNSTSCHCPLKYTCHLSITRAWFSAAYKGQAAWCTLMTSLSWLPFLLDPDPSNDAIGAGLSQLDEQSTRSPMQIVAVDIVGSLPTTASGSKYVLVAVDSFTKWMEANAIPNQEAVAVAKKRLDEMFCWFSLLEKLHSDQGSQFEGEVVTQLCRLLAIEMTRTILSLMVLKRDATELS
eukprot:Em0023g614a